MPDPRIIARDGRYFILARDVREGDLLDLEGDRYADPNGDGLICPDPSDPDRDPVYFAFEFEFAEVIEPSVQETADCIVVHTSLASVGFPPDHEIETTLAAKDGMLRA